MFPWKMFFRSFSALVLFLTGGFAAGHELPLPTPFDTPTEIAASPAAPAVDDATTTTSAPAVDDSTTTTTTTGTETSPVVDPVPVPTDSTPSDPATPVVPVPPSTPAAPPVVAPAPDPAPGTPPAAPADPDAPSVCAAAATNACGPAPTADNTHAARVERCQDWWKSLAQALADNGRPDWAARATRIADRCDAMITRWEQWEQRWRERQDRAKGDHNGDGNRDNGWHKRGERAERPAPPAAQRSVQKASRHGEGR